MILEFNTLLGTPGQEITLPLGVSESVNVNVDWGDGNTSATTSPGDLSHIYTSDNTYTVTITGTLERFGKSATYSNVEKLTQVTSWGSVGLLSINAAFYGATNLSAVPNTLPSTVTDIQWVFRDASSFNGDIGGWETSAVTLTRSMFWGASSFNQDIDGWDVSNVTDMQYMFAGASSFNQSLNSWETSAVTDMANMFDNATAFNGNISSWDTGLVEDMGNMFAGTSAFNQDIGGWDVSSVQNMTQMFEYCVVFNQDLSSWITTSLTDAYGLFAGTSAFNQDIGGWDTSNVTRMEDMFLEAISFDQDISSWNVTSLTNANGMFSYGAGLSTANYNALLIGWSAQAVLSGVDFDGGTSKYYVGAPEDARDDILIGTNSWTITDSGIMPSSPFYVDINASVTSGIGTSADPFNYDQMVNYFDPDIVIDGETAGLSAADGDELCVTGNRDIDDPSDSSDTSACFIPIRRDFVGDVVVRGWDVGTKGPPIVHVTNQLDGYNILLMGDSGSPQTHGITLKDFIFYHDDTLSVINAISSSPYYAVTNVTFKNVLFKTNSFLANKGGSGTGTHTISFYGCTIDVAEDFTDWGNLGELIFYDTVFYIDKTKTELGVAGTPIPKLTMSNNITNITDFSDIVYATDLTEYIEPTTVAVTQTADYPDPLDFIAYYTVKENLRYTDFSVPDSGGATEAFRTTNDYNNGLWDDVRLSYGSYYFIAPDVVDNSHGHIGAFNFGDEYSNADPIMDSAIIDFNIVASASVYTTAMGTATIQFGVPHIDTLAFDPFAFEFSGAPLRGSSPMCVDYHAYNYGPIGQFDGIWEAVEFRWWFDYETSGGVDDYISCASDRAQHMYCGFYGDGYDVRLCVIYAPIT